MESALLTASNFEIAPADWQHTPPSVQQMMLRLLKRVDALEQEVRSLRVENARLREQTRRSSRNSSHHHRVMRRVCRPGSLVSQAARSGGLSPVMKDITAHALRSKPVGA
jgi:hypothetical protein